MSKNIKITLFVVVGIVVLASVGLNAYYFGWLNLQSYWEQDGYNAALTQVVNSVQKTGTFTINNAKGQAIVVLTAEPQQINGK